MKCRDLVVAMVVFGLLSGFVGSVQAHDPGLSTAELTLVDGRLNASLTFASRDIESLVSLDTDRDGAITEAELVAAKDKLQALADRFLTVIVDGRRIVGGLDHVEPDQSDGLRLGFRFPAMVRSRLVMRSSIISDLARGHRQYVTIRNAAGEVLAERILGNAETEVELTVADANHWEPTIRDSRLRTFIEYLHQGSWHIWIGYDHVLFLSCLLLPALLRRDRGRWEAVGEFGPALKGIVKMITAFTLAHSMTLCLAALGTVSLPSRWVESAIAASVVIAALNNLYPLWSGRGWIIAFAFGLVHGFGFANALSDLGLPPASLLFALVAFNLGVEFGQLIIIGVFFILAYPVRNAWIYRRGALQFGSLLIAILGSVWLLERSLDLSI